MTIAEIGEAAGKLRYRMEQIRAEYEHKELLEDEWQQLKRLYGKANKYSELRLSLDGAVKSWQSIGKYAGDLERECNRIAEGDGGDEQHLAGT